MAVKPLNPIAEHSAVLEAQIRGIDPQHVFTANKLPPYMREGYLAGVEPLAVFTEQVVDATEPK